MKTLLFALTAVYALSGCAIVPAYGPPGPYVVVPAPVVVSPYYGYGSGYGYGRGGRHWR